MRFETPSPMPSPGTGLSRSGLSITQTRQRLGVLEPKGEHSSLIDYESLGEDAVLSVPTPEHYLPLLYVLASAEGEPVSFPVEGVDGGSVSMLTMPMG
jgi:4,5-DOPA dioxygenase extradiol